MKGVESRVDHRERGGEENWEEWRKGKLVEVYCMREGSQNKKPGKNPNKSTKAIATGKRS